MNELIPIESVNAIDLFHDEKTIEALIEKIRVSATDFDPDVSTPGGRKIIAAQAYKVAQSKGVIDKAGKALTDGWFKKKKVVDAGRRIAREALDALRDEIRKPLDDWKAEEQAKIDAAALVAEIAADEIEAHERNDLVDREAKMAAWETEQQALADERAQQEADDQAERERAELEEHIRQEAEENAKREAGEAIEAERQKAAEAEQRGREQAEQAERDRIAAEEREQDRIKQAEADKEAAIEREQQRAKDKAEDLERARLRREEDEKRELQARAADHENRRKVNWSIVDALVKGGVSERAAKSTVTLVASGKVPSMSIRY